MVAAETPGNTNELKVRRSHSMKRLIGLLFVVCLFPQTSLWAADAAKSEIFIGFSALTAKSTPPPPATTGPSWVTPTGWQGSISATLGEKLSVLGDFGGQYKDGAHAYEYMAGVQYNNRLDKVNLFGHFLAGAATGGGRVAGVKQPSETALMVGIGGGIDVSVTDQYAIRAIQFDWLPSKPSTGWEKSQLRFGFGVVFLVN
jgi:hypothetical protein